MPIDNILINNLNSNKVNKILYKINFSNLPSKTLKNKYKIFQIFRKRMKIPKLKLIN